MNCQSFTRGLAARNPLTLISLQVLESGAPTGPGPLDRRRSTQALTHGQALVPGDYANHSPS